MRCDGSMSSAAWRDGRQAPILLHSEKGEEKLLPTCVHGHVAKSTRGAHRVGPPRRGPRPGHASTLGKGGAGLRAVWAGGARTRGAGVHPLAAAPPRCRGPLLCVRRSSAPGPTVLVRYAPQRPGGGDPRSTPQMSRVLSATRQLWRTHDAPQGKRGDKGVRQDKTTRHDSL